METLEIPKNARIFIIEGIAGAGKTTFHDQLIKNLRSKDRIVYDFIEEELMLGWKHIHISGISELRLEFLNKFLDYCEQKIKENPNAVFVINRLHITIGILELNFTRKLSNDYKKFVERVRRLPVHIYVPILDEHEIKERSMHKERDEQWEAYLKEKLEIRGFSSIEELYKAEQKKILELLEEQKIPYKTIRINRVKVS